MTETFDALWEQWKPLFASRSHIYAKNADDADDLLSTTYLKARLAFPRFRADWDFQSWVLKIMSNAWTDTARSRQLRPTVGFRDIAVGLGNGGQRTDDLEDRIPDPKPADLTEPIVEGFLDTLATPERNLVQLRMMGLEFHEIGQALGITELAAKCRLYRLRQLLWSAA